MTEIETEDARRARKGFAVPETTDAGSGAPPTIEARRIGRRNPKGKDWLLRNVCLTIRPGDRVAVLGPSGAGKTVLLRALAMLDPLDEGQIHHRGETVRADRVPSYRKAVIYLHQRPALFEGSVADNLRLPFSLKVHQGKSFDRSRIVSLLEGLGREGSFLDRSTRDLSGGEAQIVALIRATQLEPDVLLLDEPTAALDPAAERAVESLVERWYSERSSPRSLVWVSHDREQTRRMADRWLTMETGCLRSEM